MIPASNVVLLTGFVRIVEEYAATDALLRIQVLAEIGDRVVSTVQVATSTYTSRKMTLCG